MKRLPEINECKNGNCSIALNCNRCEQTNVADFIAEKQLEMSELKEIEGELTLNLVLHVLRNPYGWSETAQRTVRLAAADMLEQTERMLK